MKPREPAAKTNRFGSQFWSRRQPEIFVFKKPRSAFGGSRKVKVGQRVALKSIIQHLRALKTSQQVFEEEHKVYERLRAAGVPVAPLKGWIRDADGQIKSSIFARK